MSRPSAIINAKDLAALLESGRSDIKLLDATFVLPNSGLDPKADFAREHIAGAQFFDISDFADKENPVPHMLCGPACFEGKISALGISNGDTVVIYGQSGMIMGPARAWWTFKVFGHENVLVLNGGLPAWKAAGLPVTAEATPALPAGTYKASFQPELVRSMQQVEHALDTQTLILDARPSERFSGATPEPRDCMRCGHIPGSQNIPCSCLVDANGYLKSREELEALFAPCKSGTCEIILSCGSGVTACALALALYELGYENWSVYDGSWSEWGNESSKMKVAKS